LGLRVPEWFFIEIPQLYLFSIKVRTPPGS
jgi:hypothetical protein